MTRKPTKKTRCWDRTTPDGITYRAHAATDPETVALLDELVRAAYQHMTMCKDCGCVRGQPDPECRCVCHDVTLSKETADGGN